MTDRSFDQLLDAWMDLGPASAPDRVADAARLEARTTHQSAGLTAWPPRRFPFMNTYAKVAAAAAAIALAAFLGYTYLVAPSVGGPNVFDESAPSPSPEPAVAPLIAGTGMLEPGRYEITHVPPLRIEITVPAGWESNFIPGTVWSDGREKAAVAFFTVTDLYVDPCDPGRAGAGIGPTVDDLVEALADVPGLAIDAQADVRVSGYSGTRLDVTGSELDCGDGVEAVLVDASADRPHPGGGAGLNRWYILDVEGRRLVINATAPENIPAPVIEDVESILESVSIEAP